MHVPVKQICSSLKVNENDWKINEFLKKNCVLHLIKMRS